ncbi:RidA family protein [Amnibacterium flavum]|uniref:RidA family protein n=1 Tax=Amnibacterium flavum TaxID=2173173 RepID=A0A2V1HSH1_9MICO|nr:RidA family protein [Amnibacterium flavum]PVZ93989.1 RidA family protein [Amnibacterium flavum]
MPLEHINPDTMHSNPAFSQATLVSGGRTLYIGEQNGVDEHGAIVEGGARAQALQALDQVKRLLAAVGATQADVAVLRVFYGRDVELQDIMSASMEAWGPHPTALTVVQVHALARAGALVGIEAIAHLA